MSVQTASDIDNPAASLNETDESCGGSTYECNICYEVGLEPVVTMCGHLYCWPCLYKWMQIQSHCRVCPVCKAGIDENKVIPIYGRGGSQQDPRSKQTEADTACIHDQQIPRRPAGQRSAPTVRAIAGQHSGSVNLQPGLGIIPMLFGLNSTSRGGEYSEQLTPEQQHQAFLSRLLLMLGSFVIMCLLLF